MQRRGWSWVVIAAVALAMVSLVSNIATHGQLSGEHETWSAIQRTVSKVANAGTVLEPLVEGMFARAAYVPWPDRASSQADGTILLVGGAVGAAAVLVRRRGRSVAPAS